MQWKLGRFLNEDSVRVHGMREGIAVFIGLLLGFPFVFLLC